MTSPKDREVEVLAVQRRRRWTAAEKLTVVRETYEAGQSVSLV
jgi:transposase-like protein